MTKPSFPQRSAPTMVDLRPTPYFGHVRVDLDTGKRHVEPGADSPRSRRGRLEMQIHEDRKTYELTYNMAPDLAVKVVKALSATSSKKEDDRQREALETQVARTFPAQKDLVSKFHHITDIQNVLDILESLRDRADRVQTSLKEEKSALEATRSRVVGLVDDLAHTLRAKAGGVPILKDLLQSTNTQRLLVALELASRYGQLEVQGELLDVAHNPRIPQGLREFADGLLRPETRARDPRIAAARAEARAAEAGEQ